MSATGFWPKKIKTELIFCRKKIVMALELNIIIADIICPQFFIRHIFFGETFFPFHPSSQKPTSCVAMCAHHEIKSFTYRKGQKVRGAPAVYVEFGQ